MCHNPPDLTDVRKEKVLTFAEVFTTTAIKSSGCGAGILFCCQATSI